MPIDYAIHSDFLIHWTGKDLESQFPSNWIKSDKSKTGKGSSLSQAYVKRLHNILKYGLWLTEEPEIMFPVHGKQITIPRTPKVCFTELKLSQSRAHAKLYGRLGIGVKRYYLFNRYGRPLAYVGYLNIQADPFLDACVNDFKDQNLLNFFKPMNSNSRILNYDLYSESEWRILFFEGLLNTGQLIDPRDKRNSKEHAFFNSLNPPEQQKLKYLAPLDGWFQLIIYPSIDVKNMAQKGDSTGIRDEISRIKGNRDDYANEVEDGNWPMEIELDACRNF